MFWNKKEDKRSLPDLPPLQKPMFNIRSGQGGKSVPLGEGQGEEDSVESQELPSFPDSLNDKGFSQAAIKDAVSAGSEREEEHTSFEFPEEPSNKAPSQSFNDKYKTLEMEEWAPSIGGRGQKMSSRLPLPARASSAGLSEPPSAVNIEHFEQGMQRSNKNSDIFVKLDKFYSARKALVEAQQKMEDIDELLRRIRETKMREEQELIAWEKELITVKARMNDITVNLFEKVD